MSRTKRRLSRITILLILLTGAAVLFPDSQEPLAPELLIPGALLVSAIVIAVRYMIVRILKRFERPHLR